LTPEITLLSLDVPIFSQAVVMEPAAVPIITIAQALDHPEATLVRGVRLNSAIFVENVDIRKYIVHTHLDGADMRLNGGSAVPLADRPAIARATYTALHQQGAFEAKEGISATDAKAKQLTIGSIDGDSLKSSRGRNCCSGSQLQLRLLLFGTTCTWCGFLPTVQSVCNLWT
jgi:hypothetical protein